MDYHQPVLLDKVLSILDVKSGKFYLDGTLGNAGHTLEILKRGGIVYGVDRDDSNLHLAVSRIAEQGFGRNFNFIKGNFADLSTLLAPYPDVRFDGALFDLGLSSGQLKSEGRGFSFNDSTSLDMRLDPAVQALTAEEVINTYSYEQLFDLFSKIAQEKFSKPLALKIITTRQKQPIRTAAELSDVINRFYSDRRIKSAINPATKIFMALRIFVNSEYSNLQTLLKTTLTDPHFRHTNIAFITFHSGEDRLVKQFIRREYLRSSLKIITPGSVKPSRQEIQRNPLSRSALLRAYQVL